MKRPSYTLSLLIAPLWFLLLFTPPSAKGQGLSLQSPRYRAAEVIASPIRIQRQRGGRSTATQKSHQRAITNIQKEIERIKSLYNDVLMEIGQSSDAKLRIVIGETGPDSVKDAVGLIDLFLSTQEAKEAYSKGDYWLTLSHVLEAGITLTSLIPGLKDIPAVEELDKANAAIQFIKETINEASLFGQLEKLKEVRQELENSLARLQRVQEESKSNEIASDSSKTTGTINSEQSSKSAQGSTEKLYKVIKTVKDEETGLIILDPDRGIVDIRQIPMYVPDYILRSAPGTLTQWIANHPIFMRKLLTSNFPPEARLSPLELSDGEVKDKAQIPPGWVPCTCPSDHQGLGKFFNGVQYHSPEFHCP
jgi:hypothetical protein